MTTHIAAGHSRKRHVTGRRGEPRIQPDIGRKAQVGTRIEINCQVNSTLLLLLCESNLALMYKKHAKALKKTSYKR